MNNDFNDCTDKSDEDHGELEVMGRIKTLNILILRIRC